MEEVKIIIQLLFWFLGLMATLLLIAYGFIIKSQLNRIKRLEDLGCSPKACEKRFTKIENEQGRLEPFFVDIRERLAAIEAILKYKEDK